MSEVEKVKGIGETNTHESRKSTVEIVKKRGYGYDSP